MLHEGQDTAEDISQRYFAKDPEAAELIAHMIERELTNILSRGEGDEALGGVAAINTPYDPQVSIFAMIKNGEIDGALQEGSRLNSSMGLRSMPLDDVDTDEVPVDVISWGMAPFTIWIPRSLLKQVDDHLEDPLAIVGRWISKSIKNVQKLFRAKE